jgi:hypothetical protein
MWTADDVGQAVVLLALVFLAAALISLGALGDNLGR